MSQLVDRRTDIQKRQIKLRVNSTYRRRFLITGDSLFIQLTKQSQTHKLRFYLIHGVIGVIVNFNVILPSNQDIK